ncbi:murein hydrolase activator EnvC family protein [Trichococcus collinsii]|uniref:N-terminal domain of peptidoglycan hydrolase CwlO-containing protein n=1 Tax=Trichococcus collinsii TaxID=157076 RepID=A0AB37ZXM8_9LACT|nr:M23 family metallopeptidase [Trichococcus collinsii]CZR03207.1 peptidase m23 [Trichococcus collinsii]SDZ98737.1 N-terminal domain of peptidoglycan hydrolase CwlO-containing protein [Trichococcus collinsii]
MGKKHIALFTSILLLSPIAGGFTAQAATLEELQQQKDALQLETNTIQSQIEEKSNSLNTLESEKSNLETKVNELQSQLDELMNRLEAQEQKLADIESKILELQAEIEALQVVIDQRTEKLNTQARYIQTDAGVTDIASMLLSSENFSDLVGKITVVSKIVTANKDIVEQQEADQQKVEDSKVAVEDEKLAAEALRQDILISKNNVVAQKTEIDVQIAQVIENYELTEAEKNGLETTKADLAAQTETISNDMAAEEVRIAAERAAAEQAASEAAAIAAAATAANNLTASAAPTTTASSSYTVNSSGFIKPASGYYSSPFGYRLSPITGGSELHRGQDIAGSGAISAAQSGTVVTATYHASFGYYVVINHGTINGVTVETLYAHMQPGLLVAPGQTVSQGQQIGIMGTTGDSTGVHLHFEVHENGGLVDPLNYIGG